MEIDYQQLTLASAQAALSALTQIGNGTGRSTGISPSRYITLKSVPLLESDTHAAHVSAIINAISALQPAAVTISTPDFDSSALAQVLSCLKADTNLTLLDLAWQNLHEDDERSRVYIKVSLQTHSAPWEVL